MDEFSLTQKNLFSPNEIADIKTIPQKGDIILNGHKAGKHVTSGNNFKAYLQQYFEPWIRPAIHTTRADYQLKFNPGSERYAENFAVRSRSWYQEQLDNANLGELGQLKIKAIIVENTSLRKMPTIYPEYIDPRLAGEGYPFDDLQENLLRIGEPVLVSHLSKDKKFAFIETNAQNRGYVQAKHLAFLREQDVQSFLGFDFCLVIQDKVNLYSAKGVYLNSLDLGTVLPFASASAKKLQIMLPVRDENGYLSLYQVTTAAANVIKKPLAFKASNVASLINLLINKPYGWGGYLQNRDCAQLLKDYFAMFALHIPIFSANQIKIGKYIALDQLDNAGKLKLIAKEAVPYKTMLYRKGHITLYLGKYQGIDIMFHAVWGVHLYDKNQTEYRRIIGKSVITSLDYGKELYGFDNKKSSFLSLLSGMSVVS